MRWLQGAVVLLVLGVLLRLGLLVYAMYVLLGVLVLSRFLARQWIDHLTAERECNKLSAEVGETVAVVVAVRNQGRLPIAWLLMEDALPRQALAQRPPRIVVKGRRLAIANLSAGGRQTLMYQVEFKMRGYYQIGPLLLESGDLFGLHRRYRVLTEPHFVLVYPKVVPLEGYDLASRRPIGEVRMSHRLFEDPTRIAGVRRYEQGDAMNRIHWRATARTGVLHSKTYEPSCVAGATLLLDFHRDSYRAANEPFRSEMAITTAASLANAVYLTGQQVGFATNGRDAVDRIRAEGFAHEFRTRSAAQHDAAMAEESDRLRPVAVETRRGADQFMRILETLARVELTDGLNFAELLGEVASRLPRDATVVAVLPEATEQTAVALGNLRRAGYAVTVVLVMFEEDDVPRHVGRLLTEGIDARVVRDEASLSGLCGAQLVG